MTTHQATYCSIIEIEGGQLLIHEGKGVTTVELRTGCGWRLSGPFSRHKGGDFREEMVIYFGFDAKKQARDEYKITENVTTG